MSDTTDTWEPQLGEIAWIPEELSIPKEFKSEVPDYVPGHFPLIIHITPDEKGKPRYVWFLLLHSTKENRAKADANVHFQYKYVSKEGNPVEDHRPTECGPNCKKFLFLKGWGGTSTKMNVAGYVDIGRVCKLPLSCLRQKFDDSWILRPCSFAMITEKVKELIADRVTQWKPRHEASILCPKLDSSQLQATDLVCWVNPVLGKLVDSNGAAYTGCGPCVMTANDMGKAKIRVILDKRTSQKDSIRFADIKADPNIVIELVATPRMVEATKTTRLSFSLPKGTYRTTCVSAQHLVLEPTFEVSTDELYGLPRCYLPVGTQVCTQTVSGVDDYAFLIGPRIAKCADIRKAKNAEKKIQRQKMNGEEDHKELLQKTETGLEKIKDIALGHLTAVGEERVKGVHDQAPDRVLNTLKWLENYLLMCVAVTCLKQEGALPRADDDEVKSTEQERRSDITAGIDKLLAGISDCPPPVQSGAALRKAIGPAASQCDPFICLMNPTVWPTYEDFMPESEDTEDDDNSSDTESNASPSCPFQ